MAKFEFSGVIVWRNRKLLFVREKHKVAKNLWSFPLGYVEKGESLKETAVRECKEESGYNVQLGRKAKSIAVRAKEFKSKHPFLRGKVRLTMFYGRVRGRRSRNAELRAGWFSEQEIKRLKLRGRWVRKFLPRIV